MHEVTFSNTYRTSFWISREITITIHRHTCRRIIKLTHSYQVSHFIQNKFCKKKSHGLWLLFIIWIRTVTALSFSFRSKTVCICMTDWQSQRPGTQTCRDNRGHVKCTKRIAENLKGKYPKKWWVIHKESWHSFEGNQICKSDIWIFHN